jgi:hypothetical protein
VPSESVRWVVRCELGGSVRGVLGGRFRCVFSRRVLILLLRAMRCLRKCSVCDDCVRQECVVYVLVWSVVFVTFIWRSVLFVGWVCGVF